MQFGRCLLAKLKTILSDCVPCKAWNGRQQCLICKASDTTDLDWLHKHCPLGGPREKEACVFLCFPPASSENCAHPWLWALALPLATWTPSWVLFSVRNFCDVHQDGLALLVARPCRFWDLQVKGLDTWTSECSASVAAVAAAIWRASSNS